MHLFPRCNNLREVPVLVFRVVNHPTISFTLRLDKTNLSGAVERKDLGRGDVAGPTDNPPTVAADYTGQIMVIQHPTAITVGYTPVIHAHTAQIACRFDELLQKLDQRTGQVTQENPDFVKRGESMIAKLVPLKPMVIEPYKELPQLGRFAVRDMGMTVAVGVVTKVTPREPGKK